MKKYQNKKSYAFLIILAILGSLILVTQNILPLPLHEINLISKNANFGYLIIAIFCFIWGIFSSI